MSHQGDVLDWLDDAEFWQKKLPLTPAYTGALVLVLRVFI